MGWIPIVGGSLGVAVGGFISDRVVKGRGIYARVAVIIASLVSIGVAGEGFGPDSDEKAVHIG